MKTFTVSDIRQLHEPARFISGLLSHQPVCLISGEMGSGKTTLIAAICKEAGSTDTVSSPTFSIVNEYLYPGGSIYHFDLYRLKNETELWDMGFEEYLDSGNICLIEWPELAARWLNGMEAVHVDLRKDQEKRMISIETTRI